MVIVFILILAFALRTISINQSLWMDEAISAIVVRERSLNYIWNIFPLGDTHPPFYYAVLKIWSNLFGYDDVVLRLPSVIFGTALVYVIYLISRELKIKNVLAAPILCASSGLLIYYSQEARMYSLTTLMVSLSVYFYVKKNYLALSLSLLLTTLTDYLPTILVLVLIINTLFDKKKKFLVLLLSIVPTALLTFYLLPLITVQSQSTLSYLKHFPQWGEVLGSPNIKNIIVFALKFAVGRIDFNNNYLYFFAVLPFFATYGFILRFARGSSTRLLWLWLLVPISVLYFASHWSPGFSYFRLQFCLPALYLLIATGLDHLKPKLTILLTGIAVLINLAASLTYLLNPAYHREDWKGLVNFVEANLSESERVVVFYPEVFTPYLWYSKKSDLAVRYEGTELSDLSSFYTLDYLMDLTDRQRSSFTKLENLGFRQENVYNFRGTGQVRYWVRGE